MRLIWHLVSFGKRINKCRKEITKTFLHQNVFFCFKKNDDVLVPILCVNSGSFCQMFFFGQVYGTQWFGKIWKKNSGKDFYVPRTGPLNCYPKIELLQYMLTFLCLILQHSDLHCTILYVFWSVRHVIVTVMVPFWKYFRIIELWKRGRRDVISCLDIEKGNLKVTILQQQRAVYWNSVVT